MKLTSSQKKFIQDVLRQYVPYDRVTVFGSRATGKIKPFSDLDLLIFSSRPLSFRKMRELKEAFTESTLPFRVDIVDASQTSEEFLKRISSDEIVIQEAQP